MEELIERLRRARIGATFNFYREGDGADARCHRLRAYLEAPRKRAAPARRRGGRLPRRPRLRDPVHLGASADRDAGPQRRAPRSSAARSPSSGWRTRRSAGTSSRRTPTDRRSRTRTGRRPAPRSASRSGTSTSSLEARRVIPVGRVAEGRWACRMSATRAHGGAAGVPRRPAKIARMNDYPVVRNTILLAGSLACSLRNAPARRRRRNDVTRAGDRDRGDPRPRAGDLPVWPARPARCRPGG